LRFSLPCTSTARRTGFTADLKAIRSLSAAEKRVHLVGGRLARVCEQVRVEIGVVAIRECPTISITTRGSTPCANRSDAAVWRRSWNRFRGIFPSS
jgi:hypothetical protein